MSLTINIKKDASVATVTTEEEGKASNKVISLENLIKLFTSLNGVKRNTGYLAANLLREDVGTVSNRAYYFKDFVTDFRVASSSTLRSLVKTDNPHGVSLEESCLKIENYHFREIIGVISNSNTDAFNNSFYRIYNAILPMTGVIDDNTKLVSIFPNQFDNRVCWPSGLNTDFLNSKDFKIQSTFITRYLSSRFNSDLFSGHMNFDRLSSQDQSEFKAFLKEIFNDYDDSEPYEVLRRNFNNVFHFFLYFFLSNVKNINPASIVPSNGNTTTLGNFFNNRND